MRPGIDRGDLQILVEAFTVPGKGGGNFFDLCALAGGFKRKLPAVCLAKQNQLARRRGKRLIQVIDVQSKAFVVPAPDNGLFVLLIEIKRRFLHLSKYRDAGK